jgi:hypothetical protein
MPKKSSGLSGSVGFIVSPKYTNIDLISDSREYAIFLSAPTFFLASSANGCGQYSEN